MRLVFALQAAKVSIGENRQNMGAIVGVLLTRVQEKLFLVSRSKLLTMKFRATKPVQIECEGLSERVAT